MNPRSVSILGTGQYLPSHRVSAEELDRRLGLEPGTITRHQGIVERHYAVGETAAEMGAAAAREALENACLSPKDIDVIICAIGLPEQLIPCNAALLQKELGPLAAGIPAFDINSTCLSFLVAFDLAATLLDAGHYRTALLVSSEIASVGLNWKKPESVLFGDAAAAAVLGRTPAGLSSRVLLSRMESHAEGVDLCQIRAGGTRFYGTNYTAGRHDDFLFEMDGPSVYKMAYRKLPPMLKTMFAGSGLSLRDMDLIVPHQGSRAAMEGLQNRLQSPERWQSIQATHGNCIAATVPLGLHQAIAQQSLVRGQRCMLLGTGAGFACGAIVFEY